MRLVEVVAGDETSEETLAIASEVARAMGREPIRAADAIGFVANRLRAPVHARGAAPARRADRHARPDRPDRADRRRLPHGPVRAHGPGRRRRQLRGREVVLGAELPRAALAAAPDPGADGGRGPPWPQGGARLLRLRRRAAPARRPASRPDRDPRLEPGTPRSRHSVQLRGAARAWRTATLVELAAHGRRRLARDARAPPESLLPLHGQARRVGRRRARAGPRTDPRPDRQRGPLRRRRGRRHAPRTSTPRCGSASTGRAGRSSGPRRSARPAWSASWTRCARSWARSAIGWRRSFAAPPSERPLDRSRPG